MASRSNEVAGTGRRVDYTSEGIEIENLEFASGEVSVTDSQQLGHMDRGSELFWQESVSE